MILCLYERKRYMISRHRVVEMKRSLVEFIISSCIGNKEKSKKSVVIDEEQIERLSK